MNIASLGANSPHPTYFSCCCCCWLPGRVQMFLASEKETGSEDLQVCVMWLDFWPYMGLAQRGDLERCFSYGYSIACGNPDLLVGRLSSQLWGASVAVVNSRVRSAAMDFKQQSALGRRGGPYLCWNCLRMEPICFSCSGAGESVQVADAVGVSHFRVNRNLKNLKGQFWIRTWYLPDEILVLTWSKGSLLCAHSKAGKVNLMCPCFPSTSGSVPAVHHWLVYRCLNALPSLIWSQNIFHIFFYFYFGCTFFFFSAEDISICLMNLSAKPADSFEVVFCLPWVSLRTTGWKQDAVVVCTNGVVQKGCLFPCLWCSWSFGDIKGDFVSFCDGCTY